MHQNLKFIIGFFLGILITLSTIHLLHQERVTALENQVKNLQTQNQQIKRTNAQLEIINAQIETKNSEVHNQNTILQDKINQYQVPQILTRLGVKDCTSNPEKMRLFIQGSVCNIGPVPAKNCGLHVTLYRLNIIVKETNIELGTLNNNQWADVKVDIHYNGSALTNWTIIPVFDP